MFKSIGSRITDLAQVFLRPKSATHRQYEALRAFFVERLPSAKAAARFGYSPGSFRVLCHQFRRNPDRDFFLTPRPLRPAPPPRDAVRDLIVALRKQNLSIYDISRSLAEQGHRRSPVAVSLILKREGFERLPRREEEQRPAAAHVSVAAVADVRRLDLTPRRVRTQFGGLFLFLPYLAALPLPTMLKQADFPGSEMIPAAHALRSLLALKLFGSRRHSHVMSSVFDEGLALFAGLNRIPKRAFLTEYSCRIHPESYLKLTRLWFDALSRLGLGHGSSFDLDFHTIPYHGDDALVQKHYVSKRSRRQKGILAFVAHDADQRVFCYANSQLRKGDENDEVLRFVEFWQTRTGHKPEELIFDSRLTTYANLSRINQMGIQFMTLRRRSRQLLESIYRQPSSAWRKIELDSVTRVYRFPRVLDQRITLPGYQGVIRQLAIAELGHEEPTLLLTNQLHRSPAKLITRYAQRMVVENAIEEGISFFHMDALSSAVAMKVNCDLQLTLMASSLYRLLGSKIGNGYQTAKADHIFRDFIQATAQISITDKELVVRFQKRAHNPLLLAAGFGKIETQIPWLAKKTLRFNFGEAENR
jgi:hypothetical protein